MPAYGTFKPSNFRYLTGMMLDAGSVISGYLGGITVRALAGTTLKFGMCVQYGTTANYCVLATTTLERTFGVVVGGASTFDEVLTDNTVVGTTVCASNIGTDSVIVQRSGVSYCILDTDDVVVGSLIIPSAITAGSVGLGSTTTNSLTIPNIGISQSTETVANSAIVVSLRRLI